MNVCFRQYMVTVQFVCTGRANILFFSAHNGPLNRNTSLEDDASEVIKTIKLAS